MVFRSPSQIAYLPPDFNALHSGPSGNLTPTPVPHRSALVETLGLADNIHPDGLTPFRQQLLRDRAGLAIANLTFVHPGHGQYTRAGAGEKDLIGVVQLTLGSV